ncbi:hypothetical protein BJY52DRAFT_411830 [Lactarius psammicola]|nr:hypothetical protein BJY52DRAFT_411830 [Lactarius psammicola]
MASILKLFHDILCKFRFARYFVHHSFRRWVLFLAFLGRRLGVWRPQSDRERRTFQKAEQARHPSPCTRTDPDLQEYVVAASYVPASASNPSLHNVSIATLRPQPAAASGAPPAPADPTVESPSHRDHANPSSVFDARIRSNRRSSDSSIRSRSSDRSSVVRTPSRESLHTPVSQSAQFPTAAHRQFGRGPSGPSPRESSRSPSPTHRVPQSPRSEIDVTITNPHPQTQVDSRNGPPTVTYRAYGQLSLPNISGLRRRQSSKSVVVGVVNPSTDSLSSFLTARPLLTEEPYTIGSPTGRSSPIADTLDPNEGSSQHDPTVFSSSTTSNFDPPEGRILQPIHSEQVPRYTKHVTVPRERTCWEIPPLTRSFPHISQQTDPEQGSHLEDCDPWESATHPDGALYFFDRERRLFTDTDMLDPSLRKEMEEFYHYIQRILHYSGLVIPSKNYDLVLDIMLAEDGRKQWSYYYACHEARCLFWLETYDATHMISELFGVRSPSHIKHRLESLYWTHWSLFPAVFEGRRLDRAAVDELVGILSHGCMDVMTSKCSTLPYDVDTMRKMLELVRNAKKPDAGLVYHTAGVTRLLSFFAHWRFLYFHGQNSARLIRHKTVYTHPDRERTLLITSLSPTLFLAPEGYLRELEKVWIDEVVFERDWRNFISGLLKEWEQLILSSTVVLSVNVGFLAIPGVIASCMSIVASAGSIVIGLLLVRRNGPKQNEDPAGASTYLYQITHRTFGLEPMAVVFSLPWALLMWSMVTFFVALLLFCFGTSNAPTRMFVAVTSVAVAILVGWCIRSTLGSSGAMEAWSSGLLPCIARTLDNVRATFRRILAFIDRRLPPSSVALDRAGSVHPRPYHEGVGAVV